MGFRVEIENIELLYQHFIHESSILINWGFPLGSAALEEPAQTITVRGNARGRRYILQAEISPAPKPRSRFGGFPDHFDLGPPFQTLKKTFSAKKVGSAVYILDGEGREEVVLSKERYREELHITLGDPKDLYMGGNIGTFPKDLSSLERFKADFENFAKIIEATVNGIYTEAKRKTPEMVLFIRPSQTTPLNADQTESTPGLRGLLKSAIEIEKPNVRFSDVGGQEKAKKEIEGLKFALSNPNLYKKWGAKPPKGILLFGPPGTGKTLLAKALAAEAEASFFHVMVSDVTSMWYGQAEKLMQAVFDLAKEHTPSIIFFDEVDAIASIRDRSHEATQRMLSVLLENLDGMESQENVIVVASTNRPQAVDPALRRAGRIDREVEVPLPDQEGRKQIFLIHARKAEGTAELPLFADVDFEKAAEAAVNFSGADLAEIIRRVLEEKVRLEGQGEKPGPIVTEDILAEIKSYERNLETKKRIGFNK